MQGKVQSYQDIEHVLVKRYDAIRNHYDHSAERPYNNERTKWKQYYSKSAKEFKKLNCMDQCVLQVAKAMYVSPSMDVIPMVYKTKSTEHDPSASPPGSCSNNAMMPEARLDTPSRTNT